MNSSVLPVGIEVQIAACAVIQNEHEAQMVSKNRQVAPFTV
jgi:hypothetical protein